MLSSKDPSLKRRKLPIGIQTFREIREEGYYYVDKTPLVYRLAEGGEVLFSFSPEAVWKKSFFGYFS